jgi:hypothetical protein
MVGVNDGIADLKRHLASTPSAGGYLTTAQTTNKMPLSADMQVNKTISSILQCARQASAAAGTVLATGHLAMVWHVAADGTCLVYLRDSPHLRKSPARVGARAARGDT